MTGSGTQPRPSVPVYQDGEHAISVCENAVLTYSSAAPNPRYLQAWQRTVELVVGELQGPLLILTLIDRRAKAPDETSKRSIRATITRHASHIDAFAYVVEGEGFGAAAMRSALSLISMAARYPFPQKVFGRVEDAAPWMLSRPTHGERRTPSVAQLVNSAHVLREYLRAVAAAG